MNTLKQVLEAALDLPHEEQEALVKAIQSYKSEMLRTELVEYARQAALDVRSGELKSKSVAEIMGQLDESIDEINDNIWFNTSSHPLSMPEILKFMDVNRLPENSINIQEILKNRVHLKYIPLEYQKKEDFEDIVQYMSKTGWSLPPRIITNKLISLKGIHYCSDDIDNTHTVFYTDNRNEELRKLIDIIKSDEDFKEWIQIIEECYKIFDSDIFTCIVPCLMVILEGYLSKKIGIYKTKKTRLCKPTEEKVNAVDTTKPINAPHYLFRYSVLLVIENLYQTSDFSGAIPTSMKRHWIMHGRKIVFNPKVDALKLFNLIGSISISFNEIEDLIDSYRYSDLT
jgi:hypothetical protein